MYYLIVRAHVVALIAQLSVSAPIQECPRSDAIVPCSCTGKYPFLYAICNDVNDTEDLRNILERFSSPVPSVQIDSTSIKEIPANAFRELCITRLIIEFSHLKHIHESAFADLEYCLYMLTIVGGKLTDVPTDAIWNLTKLSTLSLSSNRIEKLDSPYFINLNLKTLILSFNRISHVERVAFTDNLESLSLSHNRLSSLNGSLRHLRKLYWLFINNNEIVSLSGELKDLEQLEWLSAEHNRIQDLTDAFDNLSALTDLNLAYNHIQRLDDSLHHLKNLQKLNLSHNSLTYLSGDEFRNLVNLRTLDLSQNYLSTLGSSLRHKKHLRVLNLSGNMFKKLDNMALGCLINLRRLDLSVNYLSNLDAFHSSSANQVQEYDDKCDFNDASKLVSLNLADNPLKCNSKASKILSRLRKKGVKIEGEYC